MTDPSESPNQPIARGSFERLLRHGRARYLRFRRSFPRLIRTDEVWLSCSPAWLGWVLV
jgi:hypothetical protein